jgi:hypothetical protein
MLPAEFKEYFKDKLSIRTRGYGYWSWKPEIIYEALKDMRDDDALIYVDAGCHVNKNGLERLKFYFEMLDKNEVGVLAFQAKPPLEDISTLNYDGRKLLDQPNRHWIKGDLFDYFKFRGVESITEAQAIGAGVIIIKKCKKSIQIIEEWRSIIKNNFSLIDDTPSVASNLNGFVEHRHDQAIFTLLCVKHNVETLSAYEYWYPKRTNSNHFKPDWKALEEYPIHARRDKDFGVFNNVNNFIVFWLVRIKNKLKRVVYGM